MTDNAIITAAQNIVIAINGLIRATNSAYGTANSLTFDDSAQQLIVVGRGRVNNISIVVDAAVTVDVYDAASVSAAAASNLLASVDANNLGTVQLNKVYSNGIVLDVGAGAQANVTYSPF